MEEQLKWYGLGAVGGVIIMMGIIFVFFRYYYRKNCRDDHGDEEVLTAIFPELIVPPPGDCPNQSPHHLVGYPTTPLDDQGTNQEECPQECLKDQPHPGITRPGNITTHASMKASHSDFHQLRIRKIKEVANKVPRRNLGYKTRFKPNGWLKPRESVGGKVNRRTPTNEKNSLKVKDENRFRSLKAPFRLLNAQKESDEDKAEIFPSLKMSSEKDFEGLCSLARKEFKRKYSITNEDHGKCGPLSRMERKKLAKVQKQKFKCRYKRKMLRIYRENDKGTKTFPKKKEDIPHLMIGINSVFGQICLPAGLSRLHPLPNGHFLRRKSSQKLGKIRNNQVEFWNLHQGRDWRLPLKTDARKTQYRIINEEQAKAAIAERRRLAREARKEAPGLEEELANEDEADRKEMEKEERLLKEALRAEEERLRTAIERREALEEEEKRRAEEKHRAGLERAAANREAGNEMERFRRELEERLRRSAEERGERRRRLEAIMARIRRPNVPDPGGNSGEERISDLIN